MLTLKPTKRNDPCPHCGKPDWCYSLLEDGEKKFSVCKRGAPPATGWKETSKLDRDGDPLYIVENSSTHKNTNNNVFCSDNYSLPSFPEKSDPICPLTESERDESFRILLNDFDLNQRHRKDCEDRLLTKEQIERSYYRSVYRKEIPYLVDNRLPCVTKDFQSGELEYFGGEGIFIPLWNEKGEIIGAQVKTQDGYRWLKSRYNSKLLNGERPITYCKNREAFSYSFGRFYPNNGVKTLWLTEGVWKPDITSQRWGVDCIGAASGHFYSSPKLLKRYLEYAGESHVYLMPDAGCLVDRSVFRRMVRTIELIESWGYFVKVGDWGQFFDKSVGDIDEIPTSTEIDFISPTRFKSFFSDSGILPSLVPVPIWVETLLEKASKITNQKKLFLGDPAPSNEIRWDGHNLPSPENYEGEIITFKKGEGRDLIQNASQSGYGLIIDDSPTGSGKTHTISTCYPRFFFPRTEEEPEPYYRLFYTSKSPRDTPIEAIQSFFKEMPARACHWQLSSKKDVLGDPVRKHATASGKEVKLTKGNCHWADKFQVCYEANQGLPLCKFCPFKTECALGVGESKEGESWGYIYLKKEAIRASRIRTSFQGLPDPEGLTKHDVLFIDEWADILPVSQDYRLTAADLDRTIATFFEELPMVAELVSEIKTLSKSLKGLDRISQWEFKSDIFESREPTELIKEVVAIYAKNYADPKEIIETATAELDLEIFWLIDFLKILGGIHSGFFAITNTGLNIYKKNTKALKQLSAVGCVIFADATGHKEDLQNFLETQITGKKILHIRQQTEIPKNNIFIQVGGLGVLNKNRSEDQKKRVAAIEAALIEKYGEENIGFIEFRKFAKDGWLHHFVDGRGSNAFAKKKAVCSFGLPCQNLGELHARFTVLYGEKAELGERKGALQEFIDRAIAAEILQEGGRNRAYARQGETLRHYICADIDIDWLEDKGYKVERIEARDISIDAGTKQQRYRSLAINMFQVIAGEKPKEKITIRKLAEKIGTSKTNLAYYLKAIFGGWKEFKEFVYNLIAPPPDPPAANELVGAMVDVFSETLNQHQSSTKEILEEFDGWRLLPELDLLEFAKHLPIPVAGKLLGKLLLSFPQLQYQLTEEEIVDST